MTLVGPAGADRTLLAIAGVPPLNGFVSEWLLLQGFLFTGGLPNPYLKMLVPIFAAGVALSFLALARGVMKPQVEGGNPWNSPSLEWVPQESYGMRSIPQVDTREPLWDRPALAGEIVDGRHWLPGTAFGGLSGFAYDEADLRPLLARARELTGVRVEGLMLLPPYADDPARPLARG